MRFLSCTVNARTCGWDVQRLGFGTVRRGPRARRVRSSP
ncbi:hypothetical protein [Alloactinosynnema sp. L-07]|nr:hypothetical protein [Alloactinosynnema sp. L-07]